MSGNLVREMYELSDLPDFVIEVGTSELTDADQTDGESVLSIRPVSVVRETMQGAAL